MIGTLTEVHGLVALGAIRHLVLWRAAESAPKVRRVTDGKMLSAAWSDAYWP